MDRVGFIVGERSYLIRKGMVSIINRIEHATVLAEMDSLDNLNSEIGRCCPDFVAINPSLFDEQERYRNFELKFELSKQGIAIISTPPYRKGLLEKFREVIDINDPRDSIYRKLEDLVNPVYKKMEPGILSNELSDREKTILTYVAKGFTNKDIADKLFLSTHTVITHRKNITNKLGIKTISGLTVYAILNKLVKIEEEGGFRDMGI